LLVNLPINSVDTQTLISQAFGPHKNKSGHKRISSPECRILTTGLVMDKAKKNTVSASLKMSNLLQTTVE